MGRSFNCRARFTIKGMLGKVSKMSFWSSGKLPTFTIKPTNKERGDVEALASYVGVVWFGLVWSKSKREWGFECLADVEKKAVLKLRSERKMCRELGWKRVEDVVAEKKRAYNKKESWSRSNKHKP